MSASPIPTVPATEAPAPPGWYDDPQSAGSRRYWDGSAWTSQVAVAAPAPTQAPSASIGLVVAGYVFAALLPFVGLILGLVAVKKHNGTGTNHGAWIIVTALVAVVVYLMLAAGGSA